MNTKKDEAESLSDHQRRLDEREGVGFSDTPKKYVAFACDEMGQTEIIEREFNTQQVGNNPQEIGTEGAKPKRGRPPKETKAQPSNSPQEAREDAQATQTPQKDENPAGRPAGGKSGDAGIQKRKRGRPRKQG